jgi:site-specific recombinase XerC
MSTPDRAPGSELDNQIEPFLNHLRAAGYAERTLRKKRTVARAFTRWAKRKPIVIDDLNDNHVSAFIARSPRRCREHVRSEQTAMRLFLRYLRAAGAVRTPNPAQDISVAADLLSRYEDFLRRDRGLAENSIHVYSPFILTFLAACSTKTGCLAENAFDPLAMRDFLVTQTHGRSEEYVRLLSIALRSFLRFLFLRGFMSLIHTCQLAGANSFNYLIELQRHARELDANPTAWMAWNYRKTIADVKVS